MRYFIVWSLLIPLARGMFHEDSQKKILKPKDLPEESLFGYSITYISSNNSLIISAPIADDIGKVFSYSLSSGNISQLAIETEIKNGNKKFWLGATVKSINQSFVACAPSHSALDKGWSTIRGFCFISTLDRVEKMQEISRNDRLNSTREQKFEELMDTFGWSLDVTPQDEVLVGGPGMTGRAAIYEKPFNKKKIPKLIYDKDFTHKFKDKTYNYGYSVVSGNFPNGIQYAISTTYGTNGYGKIYLFDSKHTKVGTIVDDEQVGSLFGAALCAVKLREYDVLVVGAPLYSETYMYDVGAVYVYEKKPTSSDVMSILKKISGTSSGGYFGNTIISLGDLDNDGKHEIAIGAPYENEYEGRVYVYTGAELADMNSKNVPLQTLKPRDKLLYFGWSLTKILDFDENGCDELAVGAPGSNDVVVYRSFASVKIVVGSNLSNITREKSQVVFESCLDVSYTEKPLKVIGEILVTVELENGLDSANGSLSYTVNLNEKLPKYCRNHTINSHDRQTVMYTISATLNNDPRTLKDFDPQRVILCSQSILSKPYQLFLNDCGGQVCTPTLGIFFSSSIKNNEYTIGSTKDEWFSLSVTNEGDTGYDVCIDIEVIDVNILTYPSTCTLNDLNSKGIICKPPHALHKGDKWAIERVILETTGLTSSDHTMEIQYNVYNHCSGKLKIPYSERIVLKPNTSFSITGRAEPEQLINLTSSDLAEHSERRTIDHKYTINNDGFTNWVELKSEIILPSSNSYEIFIVGYDGKARICEANEAKSDSEFSTVVCDIGNLFKAQQAFVWIKIQIIPQYLGLTKDDETTNFSSTLNLLLQGKIVSHNITTRFLVKNSKVPLWIIIAAVFAGLLILGIIAFALYECGFLRRKNKEKLARLQKSVHRQSMRRTMRESTRAAFAKEIAEEAAHLVESGSNSQEQEIL